VFWPPGHPGDFGTSHRHLSGNATLLFRVKVRGWVNFLSVTRMSRSRRMFVRLGATLALRLSALRGRAPLPLRSRPSQPPYKRAGDVFRRAPRGGSGGRKEKSVKIGYENVNMESWE
jgi:hypothetical protein